MLQFVYSQHIVVVLFEFIAWHISACNFKQFYYFLGFTSI